MIFEFDCLGNSNLYSKNNSGSESGDQVGSFDEKKSQFTT
jgi:hypothetical protein